MVAGLRDAAARQKQRLGALLSEVWRRLWLLGFTGLLASLSCSCNLVT
jgi:hypothetical protein